MTTTRDDYASPEGFIDRCAWEREFGPNGSKSALSTPATEPQGYVVECTLSGETVNGIKVTAYVEDVKTEFGVFPKYCGHWSTPGAGAVNVRRLFAEEDVFAARPAPQPAADTRVVPLETLMRWQVSLLCSGVTIAEIIGRDVKAIIGEPGK